MSDKVKKVEDKVLSAQSDKSNIIELAEQLGYEGTLSIIDLENEIISYQRRTVETMLGLGVRLLLLKEITPHGEFQNRIEFLGFSYRSAARFMHAALKTSKSANLALLSKEIKDAGKFLEFIAADDDVIDTIVINESIDSVKLDDIDTMTNKELRAKLRNKDQEIKKAQMDRRIEFNQLLKTKDQLESQLHEAQYQIEKAFSPATGLHPKTLATRQEAAHAQMEACNAIDTLHKLFDSLKMLAVSDPDAEEEQNLQIGAIILQTRTIHARTSLLLDAVNANGYEIPKNTDSKHQLRNDEAKWYVQEHSEMMKIKEAQAAIREDHRKRPVYEAKTKRGRKPKEY